MRAAPKGVDEVLARLEGDEEAAKLMPLLRFYLPALGRSGDAVTEGFIRLLPKKNWVEIDRYMWPYMTEDERDALSGKVLDDARSAVNLLYWSEWLFRQVVVRIITHYLGV